MWASHLSLGASQPGQYANGYQIISLGTFGFNFQAWPDHGTPDDPDGVLSFIDDINRRMIKNSQELDAPEQVGTLNYRSCDCL